MQIEKNLIYLNPLYFDQIEEWFVHVKDLKVNLGEHGKGFLKKDDQFEELILMSLKTTYDIFYLEFHTDWAYMKEDGNEYAFDYLYSLLLRVHEKFLGEGKPKNKKQTNLIKGKILT